MVGRYPGTRHVIHSPPPVQNLIEPVRQDLESHCTCGVQRMLAHFISSVAKDGHTLEKGGDDAEYLKPYLDIAIEKATEIREDIAKLQEIMDDPKKRDEDRYGQLCITFNKALDKLRSCSQDTLKKCDRLNIMFHFDDRVGVILCSHRAAKEVARLRSVPAIEWGDLAFKGVDEENEVIFFTREVLSVLEYKTERNPSPDSPTSLEPCSIPDRKRTITEPPKKRQKTEPGATSDKASREPPPVSYGPPGNQFLATNKLSSAPWITHTINMLILDDKLWVWYYDRQGSIQSQAFDYLGNGLPYFLLLLLAFQRFSPREWGYSPTMNLDVRAGLRRTGQKMRSSFRCRVIKVRPDAFRGAQPNVEMDEEDLGAEHEIDDGESDSGLSDDDETFEPDAATPIYEDASTMHEFFIDVTERFAHRSKHLVGRATAVFRCIDPDAPKRNLVLKCSWVETGRHSEGEALQYAHHVGRNVSEITKHLPAMKDLYQRTFYEHDTQLIRDALKVDWVHPLTRSTSRVARYLIEEELRPITQLVGKEFLYAMFSIARCVCLLWILGLQHTDPSLENYMVRLGTPVGVVNDWDLSVLSETPNENLERTGTIPYMALELLSGDFWEDRKPRLYRHELEGQLWVFVWVCLRYTRDGKLRSGDSLELNGWQTTDYEKCLDRKRLFVLVKITDALESLYDTDKDTYYEVYASVAYPQLVEYRARLIQADSDRENKLLSDDEHKAEDQQPPSETVEEDDIPEEVWNRLWRCLDEERKRTIDYWDDFREKYCSLPDVRAGWEVPKRIHPVEAPCPFRLPHVDS